MKIEIIEPGGIKHLLDGVLQHFQEGEVRDVPDELGAVFCRVGLAKSDACETGERDTSAKVLMPANVSQSANAESV